MEFGGTRETNLSNLQYITEIIGRTQEQGKRKTDMLVLSRKVGERILIGEEIAVTVVRVTGGGVRIGIEAPAELPVIREELKASLSNDSGAPAPLKSVDPLTLRGESSS